MPYVSVDEARRALLPGAGPLRVGREGQEQASTLKSFDCVVYAPGGNLLVEVKGRKVAGRRSNGAGRAGGESSEGLLLRPPARTRLECWVTRDDVDSLGAWERLFGAGFTAVFAFVYWCEQLPPGALFEDFVERDGRWYAIRCIRREDYEGSMRVRSERWRTVHLAPGVFDRLSKPLEAVLESGVGAG